MKRLLYLIGQPGSGKSTLVEHLTRGCACSPVPKPVAHIVWARSGESERVCELGARRQKFSGTDALSLSVQPKALAFIDGAPYTYFLAEGDRLANTSFFNAVLDLGVALEIAHLEVPDDVAEARRRHRANGGKEQNPAWVRGRCTKVAGLARDFDDWTIAFDGRHPPEGLVSELTDASPVAALLRSPR